MSMRITTKYIIVGLVALLVQMYLIAHVNSNKYTESLIGKKDSSHGNDTVSAIKAGIVYLVVASLGIWLISRGGAGISNGNDIENMGVLNGN